ncbi:hypothetical protein F9K33_04975 [bacterium]|nr:MAG: hypothetical protein F9K33_04975 [bacterium]MBL7959918.1 hypothetical protein [bacterium]
MQSKERIADSRKTKSAPLFMDLESRILRFGLDCEPTSANVVAKRLHMKENPKNIGMIKAIMEKLIREKKVYKLGSRYAIDRGGGMNLMKSFCIKLSNENYKINNYVFENISSHI